MTMSDASKAALATAIKAVEAFGVSLAKDAIAAIPAPTGSLVGLIFADVAPAITTALNAAIQTHLGVTVGS